MGNNQSSAGRHGQAATATAPSGLPTSTLGPDGGHLSPLSGTYASQPQEWDKAVVYRLIMSRAMAPFYRGLQDEYGPVGNEDSGRQTLDRLLDDAGKVPARPPTAVAPGQDPEEVPLMPVDRNREPEKHREAEALAYERGTAECPICFLNFPANMNYSRCCEQPICTECFVQIKRVDPTVTNLTSEPVACPYCVEPEFGVTYRPPAIMNRREPDGSVSRADRNTSRPEVTPSPIDDLSSLSISPSSGRRKSVSASSASVVTVDHLHPDWQAKLDAVRATAARRANRRIVFRRVGDRLIPVGITSSRDVMAAAAAAEAGMAGASPGSGTEDPSGLRGLSRRNRRRGSGREPEVQQYLSGLAGQDLEELMIMEAMRLSMLEEEERQKKEKAEREKAAAAGPIASTSTAAPAELPSIQPHASTSTQSTLPDALPPPLQPAPATSVRRSLSPGASLLTATAPAPPVTTDSTSKLLRQQSMAPSLAETEASEIDLDPGYQRLDDDED